MRSAPVLAADGVPGDPARWMVPCPFCGGLHVHSAEAGHRAPHCPPDRSPAEGYALRFAGMASGALLRRYRGNVRAWESIAAPAMRDGGAR
ncbi:hypothetical protein QWZ14_31655 [Paeniroseomonas aquatica]|uniref:Uncharacterized protein n=1 Tax=Paeniroseomonas aquatica TaxID=373043 RepID=A0ABT8AGK0_9PROT|nr:hypothetical protein [Paeniroseomonas aquatica]MDN3568958.1 hypothetical protein [Paeniroseomonas aquatica]